MQKEKLRKLQNKIGHKFNDIQLLIKALTHSSVVEVNQESYERLEFLGDAIAGFVVANHLFDSSEKYTEGQMTQMKSQTVNRKSMKKAGKRLNLEDYIVVDQSLTKNSELPPSLTSDVYEAIIGAIYLDSNLENAQKFILKTLAPELDAARTKKHTPNFKSTLQELLQRQHKEHPTYQIIKKTGPAHNRKFLAEVLLKGQKSGQGWGKTKKEAEQNAAKEALNTLYPQWQEKDINWS